MRIQAHDFVKQPLLSQPQFCLVANVDMMTANNWVARHILEPTEIGGRQIKGTRLYSISKAYEGRIIGELVKRHKIPPSDAAKIAELATKGGFIEHWARALQSKGKRFIAYMAVAWSDDCYASQMVSGDKNGLPEFSIEEMKDFFDHTFIMLPLTAIFVDVYEKSLTMLKADQKL